MTFRGDKKYLPQSNVKCQTKHFPLNQWHFRDLCIRNTEQVWWLFNLQSKFVISAALMT